MTRVLQGTIRGRTIELTEDIGLAEGQSVEVRVRTISMADSPGAGLLRTEGALADDPYWDDIMDEIYQERKHDTRREVLEFWAPISTPRRGSSLVGCLWGPA